MSMTQKDVENGKLVATEIVKLADDLIEKLDANEKTIEDKRVSVSITGDVIDQVSGVLRSVLAESMNQSIDPATRISNLTDALSSIIGSLESSKRSSLDELTRLIGTQEGMRRALEAVRETGNIRLQEIEKVVRLAATEDPEARRRLGDRPETISTKRNAKSLKHEREADDN